MDWKECLGRRIVKDVKIDEDLINSLIESSKNKLESENKLEMSYVTANSKVSLAYDSLRELLEVLALKHRFKVYNHECYVPFLKEIIKESSIADEFDEVRKIRNNINYYGKNINPEEARDVIIKIKILREFANNLLR